MVLYCNELNLGLLRSAPALNRVEMPEQLDDFGARCRASDNFDTILNYPKRRKMRRPLIDPLNPAYVVIDEAQNFPLALSDPSTKPPNVVEPKYGDYGGLWSDKTQLTLSVMRSIVYEHGIDMLGLTEEHVTALKYALADGSILQWASTARLSIQRIAVSNSISSSELREEAFLKSAFVTIPERPSITYFTSGNRESLSDGHLPRVIPVAVYYATRSLESYSESRKHWELQRVIAFTHTHPLAIVCGFVLAKFVERLVRLEMKPDLQDYVFRQLLIMELFSEAVRLEGEFGESEGIVSKELSWIVSNTTALELVDLDKRCRHSSRLCVNTLVWSLGIFLLEGFSSRMMIHTASMTFMTSDARLSVCGALCGLIRGAKSSKRPSVDQLDRLEFLLEHARRFSAVLSLPTETEPQDLIPGESLDFEEPDDELVWAQPHHPNGPLIAEALNHEPVELTLLKLPAKLWKISQIGKFLEFVTRPTPLASSLFLIAINSALCWGVITLIQHGKSITAPKPPEHEHEIHERYFPVLLPSSGGETRAYKQTNSLSQM